MEDISVTFFLFRCISYFTLLFSGDLTKTEDCDNLVNKTINKFGRIDVLVNNAGANILGGPITSQDVEKYDVMFSINVRAVYYLTYLCIPYLRATRGNIVNISSIAGSIPIQNCILYCMTKSAIEMFTKCLAADEGSSVRSAVKKKTCQKADTS